MFRNLARIGLSAPRARIVSGVGFFAWERRWLAVGLATGAAFMLAPAPAGLSETGWMAIALAASVVILLVAEPIPLPAVAMLMIVGQVALLGRDPDVVGASLLSDPVLFVLGSLMLSVAVVKRRLDRRLALAVLAMTGARVLNVSLGLSAAAAMATAIVGEHAAAAMLLPVAITVIRAATSEPKAAQRLSATLLMSICFSCAIAAIATPSGGARNAMLLDYWRHSGDAAAHVNYAMWLVYCAPVALAQLPIVAFLLNARYRPEELDLNGVRATLRAQLEQQGPMPAADWLAVAIVMAALIGFMTLSGSVGLGAVALLAVAAFLACGLVRWLDLNAGVNWGVVLLYAASLSLGAQLIETGAAAWLAVGLRDALSLVGADTGVVLWGAMATTTAAVASAMSSGNAVAFLTPIHLELAANAGVDLTVAGLVTIVGSSFAYLTVIGAPACAIVYASGYLRAREMLAVGVRLFPMSLLVLLLATLTYWPMLGG